MSRRLAAPIVLLLACAREGAPGEGERPGDPGAGGATSPAGRGGMTGAGGAAGASAPGGAAGGGAPGVGPAPAACKPGAPAPTPLRRLTRAEYNNTVRDLLGDMTAPADRFPPDEVSGGFGNNGAVLGVSPLLAERYQEAAEALAANAVKTLPALVGCDVAKLTSKSAEDACARAFIDRFGRRAYRRPLAKAEADRVFAVFEAARAGVSGGFARGIEVAVRAFLQSPSFLYRADTGTPYDVASRLSYLLWGTMPDDKLLLAAERNELATADQVGKLARAMLDDPRARKAVVEFYRQWLGLGALDRVAKDASVYRDFTDELRAAMAAETPAFVEHLLWTGDRKLASLLTAPIGFVTPALARLYGVTAPAGAGPQRVMLPAAERAGVLTHAGLLAVHALPDQSSPVHRGKFVRERVLCQEMPPQPPGLMVSAPEIDRNRPTRDRFAQHANDAACSGCHRLMDPIGFGFESFDGIGRLRTSDGGRPVDASGALHDTRDIDGAFKGARELGERLARSAEVRDCVATQWFRFAFGRDEGEGDLCSVRQAQEAFAASGGDLREVLVALTRTPSFLSLAGKGGTP